MWGKFMPGIVIVAAFGKANITSVLYDAFTCQYAHLSRYMTPG
jgi:hypothetical protein